MWIAISALTVLITTLFVSLFLSGITPEDGELK